MSTQSLYENIGKNLYKCNSPSCTFQGDQSEILEHIFICPLGSVDCPFCKEKVLRGQIELHNALDCTVLMERKKKKESIKRRGFGLQRRSANNHITFNFDFNEIKEENEGC